MQTVTLNEAKTQLPDLVQAASAGEGVFIKKNDDLTFQLVPRPVKKGKRHFGSAKGLISMTPDFDEPLEDFQNS